MRNGKTCFGVIIGTRAYFNSELARDVRKQLLLTMDELGYEYVILPEDATPTGSSSIETREDGLKVSKQFREHRDEIDERLVAVSENWAIDRMPVVDRAILRLATYEMLFVDDVPVSVSINEAVELAKAYGGEDDSSRFVNGVLGRIARTLEGGHPHE